MIWLTVLTLAILPAGAGDPAPSAEEPGEPIPGEPIPGEPIPGEPIPGEPIPGEPIPGEVVVVTGSRTEQILSEAVVATEVVTREQIEQSGAEDAAQALRALPGVQITETFRGAGVRMQGLDSEYVLVLVDGQRVVGRRDGVLDLSRIPAERIERIEVVKGAASALYGSDAIAGVVNVITRQPEDPFSVEGHVSYGSRNTAVASTSLGWKRERFTFGSNLGWHSTDGYDRDPTDAQTDGNKVRQGDLDIDLAARPASAWKLGARGAYQLRDSQGVDQTGPATFDRRNLYEDASAHLFVEHLPEGRVKVRGNLAGAMLRDQYVLDQQGSDELDGFEESREILAQLDSQLDWLAGRRQLVSVGAEGSAEGMASPRLSRPGERYRLAVFAQDEVRIGPGDELAVVPSARVDLDSWFGVHPTPRLALRWDPLGWLALRSAAGQGFRAPTFKEMFLYFENPAAGYQVEGDPDLVPETSFNLSLGAVVTPAGGTTLRVDGFHNQLTDMITIGFLADATGESYQRWGYVNISDARTTGFEVAAAQAFGEVADIELSYGFLDSWDGENERPLDGRAPHRGTLSAGVAHPPWGLSGTVRAEVVGTTRFYLDTDGDGVEDAVDADPYLDLGLRLQQVLWRERLTFFVGVDNLLDAGDALYIHLAPRTLYGGLTVRHSAGAAP
jgi:outer membrane receptor for ferrienterochelin and colicins